MSNFDRFSENCSAGGARFAEYVECIRHCTCGLDVNATDFQSYCYEEVDAIILCHCIANRCSTKCMSMMECALGNESEKKCWETQLVLPCRIGCPPEAAEPNGITWRETLDVPDNLCLTNVTDWMFQTPSHHTLGVKIESYFVVGILIAVAIVLFLNFVSKMYTYLQNRNVPPLSATPCDVLQLGTPVLIRGLTGDACEHNDSRGVINSFDDTTHEYNVQLQDQTRPFLQTNLLQLLTVSMHINGSWQDADIIGFDEPTGEIILQSNGSDVKIRTKMADVDGPIFKEGARLATHGLTSLHSNDRVGTVKSYDHIAGMYLLHVNIEAEIRKLHAKPENLRLFPLPAVTSK